MTENGATPLPNRMIIGAMGVQLLDFFRGQIHCHCRDGPSSNVVGESVNASP